MSFYDTLIENGYRPRDLDNLSQDQLAVLVQEEHIENTWSPAARASAIAARKMTKSFSKQTRKDMARGIKSKRRLGAPRSYQKDFHEGLTRDLGRIYGRPRNQLRKIHD